MVSAHKTSPYLIGVYLVINGALYMLNGVGVAIVASIAAPSASWLGVLFFLVGAAMLVSGSGVMMERSLARYVAIAVLGFDIVEKALGVYLGDTLSVVWLVLSLWAFGTLVFLNPLATTPRADLDEDQSVHSIGNLRR